LEPTSPNENAYTRLTHILVCPQHHLITTPTHTPLAYLLGCNLGQETRTATRTATAPPCQLACAFARSVHAPSRSAARPRSRADHAQITRRSRAEHAQSTRRARAERRADDDVTRAQRKARYLVQFTWPRPRPPSSCCSSSSSSWTRPAPGSRAAPRPRACARSSPSAPGRPSSSRRCRWAAAAQ